MQAGYTEVATVIPLLHLPSDRVLLCDIAPLHSAQRSRTSPPQLGVYFLCSHIIRINYAFSFFSGSPSNHVVGTLSPGFCFEMTPFETRRENFQEKSHKHAVERQNEEKKVQCRKTRSMLVTASTWPAYRIHCT